MRYGLRITRRFQTILALTVLLAMTAGAGCLTPTREGPFDVETSEVRAESRPMQTEAASDELPRRWGPWVDASPGLAGTRFEPGHVEMTSPSEAWITSRTSGVLYQWDGGLTGHSVPAKAGLYHLSALHAGSDTIAWVAANPNDCHDTRTPTPLIGRFDAASDEWILYAMDTSLACATLTDVWISPDEDGGFAGGGLPQLPGKSLWLSWDGRGDWTREPSPGSARITAIELDIDGVGFVGFDYNECADDANCNGNVGIMAFEKGRFGPADTSQVQGVMDIDAAGLAVGAGTSAGDNAPKLYHESEGVWNVTASPDPDVEYGYYSDVTARTGSSEVWIVGVHLIGDEWTGVLIRTSGEGAATVIILPGIPRRVSVAGPTAGLVAGDGFMLALETNTVQALLET